MSLSAITDDIVVRQGSTWRDSYTCQDSDGVAVDLSGCTAAMHVRASATARSPLLVLTTDDGGLVVAGPEGLIVRSVADEASALLPVGTWVYDLFITFPDGQAQCLAAGFFTVQARVTQPVSHP